MNIHIERIDIGGTKFDIHVDPHLPAQTIAIGDTRTLMHLIASAQAEPTVTKTTTLQGKLNGVPLQAIREALEKRHSLTPEQLQLLQSRVGIKRRRVPALNLAKKYGTSTWTISKLTQEALEQLGFHTTTSYLRAPA